MFIKATNSKLTRQRKLSGFCPLSPSFLLTLCKARILFSMMGSYQESLERVRITEEYRVELAGVLTFLEDREYNVHRDRLRVEFHALKKDSKQRRCHHLRSIVCSCTFVEHLCLLQVWYARSMCCVSKGVEDRRCIGSMVRRTASIGFSIGSTGLFWHSHSNTISLCIEDLHRCHSVCQYDVVLRVGAK
jgi:hypothetical protein